MHSEAFSWLTMIDTAEKVCSLERVTQRQGVDSSVAEGWKHIKGGTRSPFEPLEMITPAENSSDFIIWYMKTNRLIRLTQKTSDKKDSLINNGEFEWSKETGWERSPTHSRTYIVWHKKRYSFRSWQACFIMIYGGPGLSQSYHGRVYVTKQPISGYIAWPR